MGGDEFLVMSSGFDLASQAQELGAQLVKSIAEPFTVSQHHCQIGLTVGYAIAPNNARHSPPAQTRGCGYVRRQAVWKKLHSPRRAGRQSNLIL